MQRFVTARKRRYFKYRLDWIGLISITLIRLFWGLPIWLLSYLSHKTKIAHSPFYFIEAVPVPNSACMWACLIKWDFQAVFVLLDISLPGFVFETRELFFPSIHDGERRGQSLPSSSSCGSPLARVRSPRYCSPSRPVRSHFQVYCSISQSVHAQHNILSIVLKSRMVLTSHASNCPV